MNFSTHVLSAWIHS